MSKKFILFFLVIAVGLGYYFFIYRAEVSDEAQPLPPPPQEKSIEIVDDFNNGVHVLTGEILVPTPCHALSHKITIAPDAYPEKVQIDFTSKQMSEICAAVITPAPFSVLVEVSESAHFSVTYEGKEKIVEIRTPHAVGEEDFSEALIIEQDEETEIEEDDLGILL